MDSQPIVSNSQNNSEKEKDYKTKYYISLISKWTSVSAPKKTVLKLLPVFFILAAIPLTVNLLRQQQNINQQAAGACLTSATLFQGQAISPQAGVFEVQFDSTPNSNKIDADTGFSQTLAKGYKDMAVIVEFNNQGFIAARNGGSYQAINSIPYSGGTTYHFRLNIDVQNHKYSAYVTPAGGTEQTIGTNFAFRSEQGSVGSLSYWNLVNTKGNHTVCNLFISSAPKPTACITSTTALQRTAISPQAGVFEAQFDSTPNANLIDADTGFSQTLAGGYKDMAVIVEFNKQGYITARNGSSYQALNTIPYAAGNTYHFRLNIDVQNHKYSAYVTPPGQSEKIIGTNFAFRTEQAGVVNLSYLNLINTSGSHTVCNFSLTTSGSNTVSTPTITTPRNNSPTPTLIPTQAPSSGGTSSNTAVYGTGVGGDTRNNHRVGDDNRNKLSYRFRATTSSLPASLRVSERGDGGANTYSGGNGGTIRATIQTDSGGKPSGTVLAATQWNPGNPSGNWEVWPAHTFTSTASLTKGQLYHIVFENVAADPITNYISFNTLFTYSGSADRPIFGNDFATLYPLPSVASNDIPIFDLTYADGAHDGMNYIGCMVSMSYVGIISGSNMVRETLNISGGNRTVSSVAVRVRRSSGSSPLVIRLEKGDGTLIEEVSVSASSIAQSSAGGDNGGAVWANANFTSPHVLSSGQSYNLVLKTASGTEYTAAPLQEGTSKGMRSYAFTDGVGQRTANGSSWSGLYGSEADIQFYFK